MLLGQSPIASLSETSKHARLCANTYPIARADVLRAHPWNCCIKRVELAPLAAAPVGGQWSSQFAKPGDWLRTLDVGVEGQEEYQFEGGRILANTTALVLRYVADVTEGNWDSNLVGLMVLRMVKDLAYPVTKSTSLAELKAREYEMAKRHAKTTDAQENPPEEIVDSPFIAARSR